MPTNETCPHVLVTRPSHQASALCDELVAHNFQPICFPTIQIASTENRQHAIEQLQTSNQANYIIFISANAAEQAIHWLDQYWPMLPDVQLFAVGQHTGEILRDYGCTVLCPEHQQNTEGLLHEMPQLQSLDNQSVIIFRGAGGRTTLADTLTSRGAIVSYCDLYRRVIDPVSLAQAQLEQYLCLVAHSGELLQAMGPARTVDTRLVVPSERVAAMGRELGYSHISVADNALPDSMFRAVQLALV